jgi:hypothetical protein
MNLSVHIHSCGHVFQWLRRGFGLVNRFIGSSLVVTTISSYTVTIAHVTSHIKYSNSSSGHTGVPLEPRSSGEVNSHFRILSYPLGTDHAQKTQFYCCVAQTTRKTSHVITISPVHWLADCCLVTSYKHSSYCCEVFIAPLPSYTSYSVTGDLWLNWQYSIVDIYCTVYWIQLYLHVLLYCNYPTNINIYYSYTRYYYTTTPWFPISNIYLIFEEHAVA